MTAARPICPDCRNPVDRLHPYYGRLLCSCCKLAAIELAGRVSDAPDDPRWGQARDINRMRRDVP